MAVKKRSKFGGWCYDFAVAGVRYRGSLPGARTKSQALFALAKKRDEIMSIEGPASMGTILSCPPKKGFLYALQMVIPDTAARPIKLGFTRSPSQRVNSLNTCGPYPVQLMATWPAPEGLENERRVIAQFAHLRLLGEWFAPAPELIAFIAQVGQPPCDAGQSNVTRAKTAARVDGCK